MKHGIRRLKEAVAADDDVSIDRRSIPLDYIFLCMNAKACSRFPSRTLTRIPRHCRREDGRVEIVVRRVEAAADFIFVSIGMDSVSKLSHSELTAFAPFSLSPSTVSFSQSLPSHFSIQAFPLTFVPIENALFSPTLDRSRPKKIPKISTKTLTSQPDIPSAIVTDDNREGSQCQSTTVDPVAMIDYVSSTDLKPFIDPNAKIQKSLQSTTRRLEKMRVKKRDVEQWMARLLLLKNLRERIRRYEQYKWQETRGVNEENLVYGLPKDLRRDIKRHLCLDLLMRPYLGVHLLDRFLTKAFFRSRRYIEALSISCLTLATRIEEKQPYNTFYLKAANADEWMKQKAKYLAELTLRDNRQLRYWPSTVAAVLVVIT
ncbi:hypothetical protein Droror1_Dr00018664 [Drosera rotundifolia]